MEGSPALKKDWVVSQAAFDSLLLKLDPDRERAGERYEQIRQKLAKFFQWRGCPTPDEFADRTIDRVARKVGEGAEIHTQDVYLFFHGVAVNVLREHWKDVQRTEVKALDDLPGAENAGAVDPVEMGERETERGQRELKLECLDGCVQKLPAQQLMLITQYHQGEGGAKIARRNELASELGIPLNALRIRAYRIRGELESCISQCVQKGMK
jgi:DNA-directed RNA polymerase specialized sigma24 family protein